MFDTFGWADKEIFLFIIMITHIKSYSLEAGDLKIHTFLIRKEIIIIWAGILLLLLFCFSVGSHPSNSKAVRIPSMVTYNK